jgi:hypothetical protein
MFFFKNPACSVGTGSGQAGKIYFYQLLIKRNLLFSVRYSSVKYCNAWTIGWIDIRTGTKVPLRFVTYLSKVTKINEKSVLTQ